MTLVRPCSAVGMTGAPTLIQGRNPLSRWSMLLFIANRLGPKHPLTRLQHPASCPVYPPQFNLLPLCMVDDVHPLVLRRPGSSTTRLSLAPGTSVLPQTNVALTLAFNAAVTIRLFRFPVVLNRILVRLVVLVLPIMIIGWL